MAKKKEEQRPVGRPTEINRPTRRIYLTLDEETIDKAQAIGGGNASAGVRIAVAAKKLPAK